MGITIRGIYIKMNDLTDKYRPATFNDVLGQESVVSSLEEIISKDKKLPSCLLFTGPSGIGKTTLARICAKAVGCLDSNIIEINAAKFTGIDDMREVTELANFMSFGGSRVFIIDEVHGLSKQAFDSLLKNLEEPSKGTSWILCSTNPTKIPKSIKTRCHDYELKKVTSSKIQKLLSHISETEKFETDKSILTYIAIKAEGSPRQAIKYLDMSRGLSSEKVKELIKETGGIEGSPEIIKLCQVIAKKGTFAEALSTLKGIEDDNESIRLTIVNYMNKVTANAKSNEQLEYGLQVLNVFTEKQFFGPEKHGPVLVALAKILWKD
jgi:DNA polymerase-3 subunit gamma/tau